MPEPSHDVRRKLVERGPDARHVTEKIVDGLGVKPDIDEVKKRIRYASAWFNWELTVLEGAE